MRTSYSQPEEDLILYTWLLGKLSFFEYLADIDEDISHRMRQKGCSRCGRRLAKAPYRRKPRGGPVNLPERCKIRRSLCCSRIGCRGRRLPPSVIYLGRRVYLSAAIVLVSVILEGATPRRMASLSRLLGGASRVTLARWRKWWIERFPETMPGRIAAASIVGLERDHLPRSVYAALKGPAAAKLISVVRLLAGPGFIDTEPNGKA